MQIKTVWFYYKELRTRANQQIRVGGRSIMGVQFKRAVIGGTTIMDKRGLFDFSLLSVQALSSSRQIISRPWPGDESSTQSTSTPQFSKSRDKILFHSVPISAHRCVRCRLPDAADFYMARRKDTRNPGQSKQYGWRGSAGTKGREFTAGPVPIFPFGLSPQPITRADRGLCRSH